MPRPVPSSPATVEVDLDAIRSNVAVLRPSAPDQEIVGVVKADAYGHGAEAVARVLVEAGVTRLAVATVQEAIELRQAGILSSIHVFGAVLPADFPTFADRDLVLTVASEASASAVRSSAAAGLNLTVHVKVDTGMHRLGIAPTAAPGIVRTLRGMSGVNVEGMWSHLATADLQDPLFASLQIKRFQWVMDELGADCPPVVHVQNGPAYVRAGALPALEVPPHGLELIRLGGVLYGLASDVSMDLASLGLRPAMRLSSRVVHLQTVDKGESVSYGRRWVASEPTRVATVSIGYADGVPRRLSNRGMVGIRGALLPVIGTVCMDMLMVDVGVIADDVTAGDEVVIFGSGGPRVEEAAACAGTMGYELTCGVAPRVARLVLGSEA